MAAYVVGSTPSNAHSMNQLTNSGESSSGAGGTVIAELLSERNNYDHERKEFKLWINGSSPR